MDLEMEFIAKGMKFYRHIQLDNTNNRKISEHQPSGTKVENFSSNYLGIKKNVHKRK